MAGGPNMSFYYERLHVKKIKAQLSIKFINDCLKKNLIPTFANLRLPYKMKEGKKKQIRREYMQGEIHFQYSKLRNINTNIEQTLEKMRNTMDTREMTETIEHTRRVMKATEFEIKRKHSNKINTLNRKQVNNNTNLSNHKFYNRFTNLSDNLTFNEAEQDLLNKGYKYSIPGSINQHKQLINLAIDLDHVTKTIDFKVRDKIRGECIQFVLEQERRLNSRHKPNNKEIETLKNIKDKIKTNNIIVVKADKNAGMVFLDRHKYIEKTDKFFTDNNITKINRNPFNSYKEKIKTCIKIHKDTITELLIPENKNNYNFKLSPMNPTTPKLYGQIKLHKNGHPIRPVVSFTNSPASIISKLISQKLPTLLNYNSTYSINNSAILTEELMKLKICEDHIMVSFDVSNLYTNVPIKETLKLVEDYMNKTDLSEKHKTGLINILDVCLQQNFFQFNGEVFKMEQGLPMGSQLSPLLSNIFMDDIENKIFNNLNINRNKIIFWKRYVDDVLCIWKGTPIEIKQFLEQINNIHKNIKFTMEMEIDNSINFLDLKIYKNLNNNNLEFGIYHKPTQTDITIPKFSNHCDTHKFAAFNSYIHRLTNTPITIKEFEIEENNIKQIAINNGFTEQDINALLIKKLNKNRITKNDKDESQFRAIRYYNRSNRKLVNIFKRYNINLTFKTNNTLIDMLSNAKDKIETLEKNGVYKLYCQDCKSVYVGETGRKLETRIKEHIRDITTSSFGRHLHTHGHRIDAGKTRLLHQQDKNFKLLLLESLEIDRSKNNRNETCLNECTELDQKPIYKYLNKF